MTQTAVSEENSTDVKIAVMNNDIKHINETLGRMEAKFDTAINSFVTNTQFADLVTAGERRNKDYDRAIENLQSDVKKLREKDAEQQGVIDTNKQNFNRAIAIATLIAVALGALWWLQTLLQRH